MICIMHEGTPYGHLTIGTRPATPRQIGTITGVGEKEATKLIEELEDAGVFSRNDGGVIFSRRMVRDHARSEEGRRNIDKRGDRSPPSSQPTTPPTRGASSDPVSLPARPAASYPSRGADTLEAEAESESEAESEKRKREREARAQAPAARPRQAKIHSDWFPDADGIECAKEAGIPDVVETIGQFVDYYTANGKPMADWGAAWRVWCRREPELRRNGK